MKIKYLKHMIIGSSNSALNVEENTNKSVKVELGKNVPRMPKWHIPITFPADLTKKQNVVLKQQRLQTKK